MFRKTGWLTLGLSVVMGVLLWVALDRQAARADEPDPVVNVPTPTLPPQNGFDTILTAGKALVDTSSIDACFLDSAGVKYPQEARIALLEKNKRALDLLCLGIQKPYMQPPVRSLTDTFPFYSADRRLARLLLISARVDEVKGDWPFAAGNYLDVLEFGAKVKHGAPLLGYLVGVAIQSMALKPFWTTMGHLNAAQTREVLDRMRIMKEKDVTLATALQEEKWVQLAALVKLFQQHPDDWRQGLTLGSVMAPYQGSKQQLIDEHSKYLDAWIKNAQARYPALKTIPAPNNPISKLMTLLFPELAIRTEAHEAQHQLLLTAMALQAYHQRMGNYPESLSALMPNFLKELPQDPFSLSLPLRYHRTDTKYLLYSIGPDGKDDDGNAMANPMGVKQDGTGDIVAGEF